MTNPFMQDDENPLKKIDTILHEWARTVRDNIKQETGHRSHTIEYIMQRYGGGAPRGEGKAPMPWNDIADVVEAAMQAMPTYFRKAIIAKYLWHGNDESKAAAFGKEMSGRRVSRSHFIKTVREAQGWLLGRWSEAWLDKQE